MARGRHKPPFEQLIDQYLFHLSDQRCAEATLRWHRYQLVKPLNRPRSGRRRRTPPTGTETTARARASSTASLKSVQSSLRSFCRWLHATGLLQTDLLTGAGSPRLSQTIKETFSAHGWVA